ncbi:MAG TPA: tail fiber domain-containing protein [Candidatus Paceibacterota bacterium]|nr:tail fiber domain-containing protein [Candidatus Paceibacterota bacterium]
MKSYFRITAFFFGLIAVSTIFLSAVPVEKLRAFSFGNYIGGIYCTTLGSCEMKGPSSFAYVATPQTAPIIVYPQGSTEYVYDTHTVQTIREVTVPGITREEVIAQIDVRMRELLRAQPNVSLDRVNKRIDSFREDMADRFSDVNGDISDLQDDIGAIDFSRALSVTDTATSSIAGLLSLAQYVVLAEITPPSDTSNSLYNDGGNLYWAGNLLAGAAVGNWASNGTDVWRASGNVGVGTNTPTHTLTVDGGGYTSVRFFNGSNTLGGGMFLGAGGDSIGLVMQGGEYNSSGFVARATYASDLFFNNGYVQLRTDSELTPGSTYNPTTRLIIDRSGLVGIGNSSPLAQLHVTATASTTKGLIIRGASNQSSTLQEWQNSAGTALTVINASGSIGIGTTTPAEKFDIYNGNIRFGQPTYNSSSFIKFYAQNSYYNAHIKFSQDVTTNSGNIEFFTGRNGSTGGNVDFVTTVGGTPYLRFQGSSGNVGIGTTSPQFTLTIATTSSGIAPALGITNNAVAAANVGSSLGFYGWSAGSNFTTGLVTGAWEAASTNDSYLAFSTRGSNTIGEKLRITSVGNVGIGSTSPIAKLSIVGSAGSNPLVVASSTGTSLLTVSQTGALTVSSSGSFGGTVTGTNLTAGYGDGTIIPYGWYATLVVPGGTSATSRGITISGSDTVAGDVRVAVGTTSRGTYPSRFNVLQGDIAIDTGYGLQVAVNGTANRILGTGYGNGTTIASGQYIHMFPYGASSTSTGSVLWVNDNDRMDIRLGLKTGFPKSALDVVGGVSIGTYGGVTAAPSNGLIVSGNVGIGTTTPGSLLTVGGNISGDIVTANTRLITNDIRSSGTLFFNTNINTGSAYSFLVSGTSFVVSPDADLRGNIRNGVGNVTFVPSTNSRIGIIIRGVAAQSADLFQIQDSSSNTLLNITAAGSLGIGTTSPAKKLHVYVSSDDAPVRFEDTNGYCEINPTSTTWTCTSDERLKKDVASIDPLTSLERITALRPVSFQWNSQSDDTKRFGLIAQEVEKIFPELVSTDSKTGYKSVAYGNLTPFIINSIQELDLKVKTINEQLETISYESFMANTLTSLKKLVVETFTVGSQENPTGITLYDEVTGEPYCVKIKNGKMTTTELECGAKPIDDPGPAPTPIPLPIDPISEEQVVGGSHVEKEDILESIEVSTEITEEVQVDSNRSPQSNDSGEAENQSVAEETNE